MKCPNCRKNHKKKDGMQCACGYQFALDPKASAGLTDGKFLAIVKKASGDGAYCFTNNQLYTAYCQRKVRHAWACLVVAIVLLVIAVAVVVFAYHSAFGFGVLLGFLALAAFGCFAAARWGGPPSQEELKKAIKAYVSTHKLKGRVHKTALDTPPPTYSEQDIYDYGVERLLVVQRDILVDLFVRNKFHAEQRTLILSANGYPAYLLPVAQKLLAESPDLPVFLLHDSTRAGMAMAGGDLPPIAGHPVIDLGITPQDVKRITRLRALKAARQRYEIAVDLIPYATLSAMVAEAMTRGKTFDEILILVADGDSGCTDSSFG